MTDEHLAQTCAELDAENARLHGELIDVRAELATARHEYSSVEGHWVALEAENERLYQETQRLVPLCPCKHSGANMDVEQECPVHGDGTTFVNHVQRLEATAQAARTYVDGDHQGPNLDLLIAAVERLDGAG